MKKIGIIVNNKKDSNFRHLKLLVSILLEAGFTPLVTRDYRTILPDPMCEKVTLEEMFRQAKLVITLGGDGTLLNIADIAAKNDVTILGVNLGTLGYLAQLDKSEIEKIPELLKRDYLVQDRMMLTVSVFRNSKKVYEYSALNDVVVTRSAVLKPVYVDLYGDTGLITTYFCDGLIFSTPTGSTAYSLSVGGPIMDPSMKAILVSAISPHALSSHSLVFDPEKELECKVRTTKNINSLISVDGRHVFYIQSDDKIVVKKNDKNLKLVKLTNSDFYTVLKRKLATRGDK